MKVYLHIGLHKTATSTIQYGLFCNREVLKKKGYLYPHTGFPNSSKHFAQHLIHAAFDPIRYPDLDQSVLTSLKEEAVTSRRKRLIVSSENFCQLTELETLERIRDYFNSFGKVKIIVYFRNQPQWFYSLWSQLIKSNRRTNNFSEYIKSKTVLANGNYLQKLEVWEDVFGKKNITVRLLEKGQIRENVLVDFLFACGVKGTTDIVIPENQNISPSLKTLEVIRRYSEKLGTTKLPDINNFSFRVASLIEEFANNNGWNKDYGTLLSTELYSEISTWFVDSNAALAKKYFNREILFFEDQYVKSASNFSIDEIPPKELLALSSFILQGVESDPDILPKLREFRARNQKLRIRNERLRSKLSGLQEENEEGS